MPRLSMWREGQKTNDYKYFDRTIRAQFDVGATGIGVHLYLGPGDSGIVGDATQPQYAEQGITNIQDILFLENRDRKYSPDVYNLRGSYQRSDHDFDLSQFGIFLTTGTVFMSFHYNDMMETLGRRLMNGDVIELYHLKDDDALGDMPASLKRFYVIGDCSYSSEGFSPTWFGHIWRAKLTPLVDSQEYRDILKNITVSNNAGPLGTSTGDTALGDLMSTYNKYVNINEAILAQADADVPNSGYDTSKIYTKPVTENGDTGKIESLTADNWGIDSSDTAHTAADGSFSPDKKVKGYLSGDGTTPNGLPVSAGVSFPTNPSFGDYHLRLDYMPNRLFRYDGKAWRKVEDNVRTNLTPGSSNNKTLRNSFANNNDTVTLTHGFDANGAPITHTVASAQNLNEVLRPPKDY